MEQEEFASIYEIAQLAGVSPSAVANWRTRHPDFPEPIAELRTGPVFKIEQVMSWLRRRRINMTKTFSVINLKGGVGKTTTTVALAEILSGYFGKKVLVIDLDPQTNATTMLIGETAWLELNEKGLTLAQLFKDALDPEDKKFDLDKTLQKGVSPVTEVKKLHLLPSSLDLIDVQDRLASMPAGKFYAANPTDILRKAIRPIAEDYDYILVDCPPNLGIITLNGLRISQRYVIPTVPDILSTYGIPQIIKRVSEFSADISEDIDPLGIIISKFREQSQTHINTVRQLRSKKYAPVFDTKIAEADKFAAAAEFLRTSTLRQRWGYQGKFDQLLSLTSEIKEALEA